MEFTSRPSWLVNPDLLHDLTDNSFSLPSTIPALTNLKEEQSVIAGIRQFLYWKNQLLPSSCKYDIFLAFLGPSGLVTPNVTNIMLALGEVCDLSLVEELYRGANSCIIALSFSSILPVEQITKNFLYFNNSVVISFCHSIPNQYRFRLSWLPPRFNIHRIHHLLSTLSKSHSIHHDYFHLADNLRIPTNSISGTLTLEPGGDIRSLPYLIQLPAPHKGCALLTIESRSPLCLKCHAIGHTHPYCPMVLCSLCHKVHFPDAPCGTSSYSAIAGRGITSFSQDDWVAHLTDDSTLISTHAINASSDDIDAPTPSIFDISSPNLLSTTPAFDTSSFGCLNNANAFPVCADTSECDRTRGVSTGDSINNIDSTELLATTSCSNINPLSHPIASAQKKISFTLLTALEQEDPAVCDSIISPAVSAEPLMTPTAVIFNTPLHISTLPHVKSSLTTLSTINATSSPNTTHAIDPDLRSSSPEIKISSVATSSNTSSRSKKCNTTKKLRSAAISSTLVHQSESSTTESSNESAFHTYSLRPKKFSSEHLSCMSPKPDSVPPSIPSTIAPSTHTLADNLPSFSHSYQSLSSEPDMDDSSQKRKASESSNDYTTDISQHLPITPVNSTLSTAHS